MTSESDAPVADPPPHVDDRATPERARDKLPAWVRGHPKLSIGVAALLVFAVSAVVVWSQTGEDEAESTVRQYLEAVRAGELGEADRMLDSRPMYAVTGKSLDTNWTIASVDSVRFDGLYATVHTVLKAHNGDETTFDFELSRASHADTRFEIANGYARVQFVNESAKDLRINGEPVEHQDDIGLVDVYPGVYRFGHVLEDFIDADWQQRLLAGGDYHLDASGEQVLMPQFESHSPPWTFTADGESAAQQLMKSHIDSCVAESEAQREECPFGVDSARSYDAQESFHASELDDVKWEIEEYPEVAIVEEESVFRYVDRSRGLAKLTATAESDDGTADIDLECQIRTTNLQLTVDSEDEPQVATLPGYGDDGFVHSIC